MASGKHHIKVHMMVIPKHTSMHHGDKHNDSNELNKMAFHNKLNNITATWHFATKIYMARINLSCNLTQATCRAWQDEHVDMSFASFGQTS